MHKSIFLLLGACALFLFSNCEKNDADPDPGRGQMSATIDGQTWTSKTALDGATYVEVQGVHIISAVASDNSTISLNIPGAISTGKTYTSATGDFSALYQPALAGATSFVVSGAAGYGTVTISGFTPRKVQGTFQFTGVSVDAMGNQTEVNITDGAFELDL